MREERLLERIRDQEKNPGRSATEDHKKVIVSVLRHLQLILNTRQGDVPIAGDFGIPDFTDFRNTFPYSLREIERSICQTIEKYEPRLNSVRVKFIPQEEDRLALKFKILGRLSMGDEPVVFESELDAEGKIKVKK